MNFNLLYKKFVKNLRFEILKRKKHPTIKSHISNVIEHYDIDFIIDVGANNGGFVKMLRKEGYKGTIHSFEPASTIYSQLKDISKNDAKWHTHKLALGDSCVEKTINITNSSDFTSFLQPSQFGNESYKSNLELSHQETVEVSTIDTFLEKHSKESRILLKIDTQGYDLNVVKGCTKSLSNIRCILSELSLKPIYEDMPDYLTALKTYNELGFTVSGVYPVSRDKDLSLIEMDCMFINTTEPLKTS